MLKQGQIIRMHTGGIYRVESVSESRAHIVPVEKRRVHLSDALGNERDFMATGRGIDISPNSEVEVIEH